MENHDGIGWKGCWRRLPHTVGAAGGSFAEIPIMPVNGRLGIVSAAITKFSGSLNAQHLEKMVYTEYSTC
jgi:hypothetical protein